MRPEPTSLAPARVCLWVARPGAIFDSALLERYRGLLSGDERERLERRRGDHQKQYLVTRALVRWALSRSAPVAPGSWEFAEGEHGKPRIAGPAEAPPISFNVSHSGAVVLCAVADGPAVGVDVEELGRVRRFEKIAKRFFAPREAAAVSACSEAERSECFYQRWTLKEAYIKARGLGISLPLSAFWFDVEGADSPRISFDGRIADDPRAWQFWQARIDERHLAAVALGCGAGADLSVEVRETTPLVDS